MPSDMSKMCGSKPRDMTLFKMSIERSLSAIVRVVRVLAAYAGIFNVRPWIQVLSMRIISPALMPVQQARMKAAATL